MPNAIVATMHSIAPSFHMANKAYLRSSLNLAWNALALMPRFTSSSAISSHFYQPHLLNAAIAHRGTPTAVDQA
jgi:hypothetical protein